jgi:hypothetical protein
MGVMSATTPNTTEAPQFHRWIDLPDELKLHVLATTLTRQAPITARSHTMFHKPLLIKLSLVNKQMHAMVLEAYYSRNTSAFARSQIGGLSAKIFRFPSPHLCTFLRKVELHIDIQTLAWGFDGKLLHFSWFECHADRHGDKCTHLCAPELLRLVRPHGALGIGKAGRPGMKIDSRMDPEVWSNRCNRHTSWQKHLTDLTDLKMVITCDACLSAEARAALLELHRHSKRFLRATMVQVEVIVPNCAANAGHDWGQVCDGQCGKILGGVVKGMLKH